MANNRAREILLLKIINIVAETFKDTAVLKGGMYLRLLNSKRATQDIDYIFKTKESRKIIANDLKKNIEKAGITVKETLLNSRGIIMRVTESGVLAMIEISVAEKLNCPPEKMTTSALADKYEMSARVITVMALAESYANKIAACLERKAMRDLYDISVYQPLTAFDGSTLENRLKSLVVNRGKKLSLDFETAAKRLKARIETVSQDDFERELSGLVPDEFFKGGLMIIKNSVHRLCQELAFYKPIS